MHAGHRETVWSITDAFLGSERVPLVERNLESSTPCSAKPTEGEVLVPTAALCASGSIHYLAEDQQCGNFVTRSHNIHVSRALH